MSKEHYIRAMALAMLPANANTLRICREDAVAMWRDGRLSNYEMEQVLQQFKLTGGEIEKATGKPVFVL